MTEPGDTPDTPQTNRAPFLGHIQVPRNHCFIGSVPKKKRGNDRPAIPKFECFCGKNGSQKLVFLDQVPSEILSGGSGHKNPESD